MQQIDLTDCEKEPIHIPGKIQSHGFLLVVDAETLTIVQASLNVVDLTGVQIRELCGRSIREYIAEPDMQYITELLQRQEYLILNPLRVAFTASDTPLVFNCIINQSDNVLLMEFEPTGSDETSYIEPFIEVVQNSSDLLANAITIHELCSMVCRQIRAYTGYDRVMLYRFDAEWNGEVLAESRLESLEPMEGHHYPASDIPRQARELFLKNWIRIIPDAAYTPSELSPANNPLTEQPTDLTYSVLRGVSPVHIQYLKNMHVAASLTISLIIDGRLWGMIACHHMSPKFVSYNTRKECEIMGKFFSHYLSVIENKASAQYMTKLVALEKALYHDMLRNFSITSSIERQDERLLELTRAEGISMNYRGRMHTLGQTPAEEDIDDLYLWLSSHSFTNVLALDNLPQHFPLAERFREVASGILVVPISRASDEYIVWYRPEKTRTINWAGNPDKAALVDPTTLQISPRQSFETWKQVVQGTSQTWQKAEIEAALSLQLHIQELVLKGYRQLTALTEQEKQEHYLLEMRVAERTLDLQKSSYQLRLDVEQSHLRELLMSSSLAITSELTALMKNRLANLNLMIMRARVLQASGTAPDEEETILEGSLRALVEKVQNSIRRLSVLSVATPVALPKH
jgi:chemotaxis family two-component system sensor kinase Cph1